MSKRRSKFRDEVKQKSQELSLKGHNSKFVLDKLAKEFEEDFEHEDPPCEKTISRWKNEALIKTKKQKKIDPSMIGARDTHWRFLAGIAEVIVKDFNDISEYSFSTDEEKIYSGEITSGNHTFVGQDGGGDGLFSCKELACILYNALFSPEGIGCNYTDILCFLTHLDAEYQASESRSFTEVLWENPGRLIEKLQVLARRLTFKGTCEICESWYQE